MSHLNRLRQRNHLCHQKHLHLILHTRLRPVAAISDQTTCCTLSICSRLHPAHYQSQNLHLLPYPNCGKKFMDRCEDCIHSMSIIGENQEVKIGQLKGLVTECKTSTYRSYVMKNFIRQNYQYLLRR